MWRGGGWGCDKEKAHARRAISTEDVRATASSYSSTMSRVQVYLETAQQAGFDGPYLIELSIMLLLSKVYPSLSATPAYRRYFHDLRGSDLARARQLTEDPYMLIKFKVGLLQPVSLFGCWSFYQPQLQHLWQPGLTMFCHPTGLCVGRGCSWPFTYVSHDHASSVCMSQPDGQSHM